MAQQILGQTNAKKALQAAVDLDIPALLIGETGTGKSTMVQELAEKHKKSYIRLNMNGEIGVEDFVGRFVLINGETIWQDGPLLQAMKQPTFMSLDEINAALPEILLLLNSLLDDARSIVVSQHKGEVIKCHPETRFFATMNPTDEYAGTKELNKALLSRFGAVLEINYPPPAAEVKILTNSGVQEDDAKEMVDVAMKIRQAKKEGKIYYTCSTRDLLQWGQLMASLGGQTAFELAVMNKAPNDRNVMLQIFKDTARQYEELQRIVDRLNVEEMKEQLQTVQKRERESLERERETKSLLEEAKKDIANAKAVYDKTADQIKAELRKELEQRFKNVTSFLVEPLRVQAGPPTPAVEGASMTSAATPKVVVMNRV